MSASAVSICSSALVELGQRPINSFEEGSDAARTAAILWDETRLFVLRQHPWNCAVRREILAPTTDTPLFDYQFAFVLPPDFLRALQVGQHRSEVDYRIESDRILADENPLFLRYVWNNDNVSTYDEGLVAALTAAMAARMAYAVTGSTSLRQLMEQRAAAVLLRATTIDGQDEPSQEWGNQHLLASRGRRMR